MCRSKPRVRTRRILPGWWAGLRRKGRDAHPPGPSLAHLLCTSLRASYPTAGSEQAEDRLLQQDPSSQKREVMMATIVTNFTENLPDAQALFLVPYPTCINSIFVAVLGIVLVFPFYAERS